MTSQAGDWFDRERRAGYPIDMIGHRLLLLGAGALGGALANLLSMWGFARATVVDPDHFDVSNAARTLDFPWRAVQSGRHVAKARHVAQHWRRRILTGNRATKTQITSVQGYLQELPGQVWRDADVILAAVDQPQARHHAVMLARRYGKPLIMGGFDGASGDWSVWLMGPTASACPSCALEQIPLSATADTSCAGAGLRAIERQHLPATPTLATAVAAAMVEALTEWLCSRISHDTGWLLKARLRSGWQPTATHALVTRFDLTPNDLCPHHDQPMAPHAMTLRGRTVGQLLADLHRQRPLAGLELLAPLVVHTLDDGGQLVRVTWPAWRMPAVLPPGQFAAAPVGSAALTLSTLHLRLAQAFDLCHRPAPWLGLGRGALVRVATGEVAQCTY